MCARNYSPKQHFAADVTILDVLSVIRKVGGCWLSTCPSTDGDVGYVAMDHRTLLYHSVHGQQFEQLCDRLPKLIPPSSANCAKKRQHPLASLNDRNPSAVPGRPPTWSRP
jgi:hypothetical protein